jgi:hypothetical protein
LEADVRKSIVFAVTAFALCGCADSNAIDQQVALANCQAVGISERDPQFATCMEAQVQGRREGRIERAYKGAKNIIPYERMIPHADVQIY